MDEKPKDDGTAACLVGWVHRMIYCRTLWIRLGTGGDDKFAFEGWDNIVRVDSASVAVER